MLTVHLRDSLSNLPTPLERLVDRLGMELGEADDGLEQPVSAGTPTEPSYRRNRILQADEQRELVTQYRRGATEKALAVEFGLHRQTVSAHLRRAGVLKRSSLKMTPELVERAATLYRAGWSTVQIGKQFGLGASTVGKALKRAGVRMRPPVADRWGKA